MIIVLKPKGEIGWRQKSDPYAKGVCIIGSDRYPPFHDFLAVRNCPQIR